jgi:hypothetical protein
MPLSSALAKTEVEHADRVIVADPALGTFERLAAASVACR